MQSGRIALDHFLPRGATSGTTAFRTWWCMLVNAALDVAPHDAAFRSTPPSASFRNAV
jgi:hypothetical protein